MFKQFCRILLILQLGSCLGRVLTNLFLLVMILVKVIAEIWEHNATAY